MVEYTLGFIFDASRQHVLLIHKNRPAWQAGKINGVGGKLEPGESPLEGVQREVYEETGLRLPAGAWTPTAVLAGEGWQVHVLAATLNGSGEAARTRTDEAIGWYPVSALPAQVISNLRWLVPLCLDRLQHGTPRACTALY
ncbi:MAG: 8-oxo-dGTP diphosphatase [Anaerolineae bacterium]